LIAAARLRFERFASPHVCASVDLLRRNVALRTICLSETFRSERFCFERPIVSLRTPPLLRSL
jgi:hypothetical protein